MSSYTHAAMRLLGVWHISTEEGYFQRMLGLLLLAACTPMDYGPLVVEPASGPMSGYYRVHVETEWAVDEVILGGIRGFDVYREDDGVSFSTHGHPDSGPVDLLLGVDGVFMTHKGVFEFEPATPGMERLVAVGASLSQGVQGGVPTHHGQLHSPSRFVAMQAGSWHPVPLVLDGLFPEITGADVTAAPECKVPNVVDHLTRAAIDVLAKLNDAERNRIGFYLGLVDPDLPPHNLAVGGSGVSTILHGPDADDFAQLFLSKMVFDLYGDIADPIPTSQVALTEGLEPDIIVCADTYGNDLLGNTAVEEIRDDLDALVARLAATDAEVFLSNIPRLTLLPGSGADEEEDQRSVDYVAALNEEVAKYDNVHVVDLSTAVEDAYSDGLQVGDRVLALEEYGGLVSTDGLHLSDVGYAFQANLFIDEINEALGTDLEQIDLAAVFLDDRHSPDALLEQGIDPGCLPY